MACCRPLFSGQSLMNRLYQRPSLNPSILCCSIRLKSNQVENELKDGVVVFSTSKAARHKVNNTIGLDTRKQVSVKPIIGGIITFSVLMYYMFVYEGDKNDVFQTITPESIKEQYLKSINKTSDEDSITESNIKNNDDVNKS